jgi:hypothetical protein
MHGSHAFFLPPKDRIPAGRPMTLAREKEGLDDG